MSGELPKGWIETTVGELGDWRGGGTPSKANAAYWTNGSIPWVSPKDMKRNFLDDAEDHITEDAIEGSATQLIPKQSVLIVTRSGILKHTLPVAINSRDVAINQDLKALTPHKGISAGFVAGELCADAKEILSDCSKAGTTVDSVDFDKLKARAFRLAPTAEQYRIVTKIASLFARSSRARDELAHIPKLIDRYRQAVLEAVFQGDLTADWRASNSPALAVDQFREELARARWTSWSTAESKRLKSKGKRADDATLKRRYPTPAAPDYSVDIGCPDSWTIVSLDELGWESGYGTSAKCAYDVDGVPVARIPNVARGSLDLTDMKYALSDLGLMDGDEIAPGDLIVVRTNGSKDLVGRGAVVTAAPPNPTYFASYLIRFRLVGDDILRRWISLLWHSPIIRDQVHSHAATSAGQYNVSMSELAGFALPLAPPDEMAIIIDKAEAALSAIDAVEQEYQRAIGLLPRLEASILDKAFSGQLVPQDPADEPASALLERIQAARAAAPKAKRGRSKAVG